MARIDLHVHSKYSNHPSEWFLQKIGASESYTEPDYVYTTAKSRGMDFVTITDHNRIEGSLFLKEKYPFEAITGVESTVYFPQDRCKVHILIWGLDERQFAEIERYRTDIYQLREFLKEQGLAHSVAHVTFAVNRRLSIDHVEQLMLLFNVFEAINGGRNKLHNMSGYNALRNLTPGHIEDMYHKHRIEPAGPEPWNKGFTGGSDDHGGLFIAQTYTQCNARTAGEVIDRIRERDTEAGGRCGDFQSLAFTVYKVAYEFSKSKTEKMPKNRFSEITRSVFEENGTINILNTLRSSLRRQMARFNTGENMDAMFFDLMATLRREKDITVDKKLHYVYDKIADFSDSLLRLLFNSLDEDIRNGNVLNVVKNLSFSLPGMFLSAPFFSTYLHMGQGKELLKFLETRFGAEEGKKSKNILWFTDSLTDLNGVSTTLQKIGWLSHQRGLTIRIATSLSEEELMDGVAPNVMNLPHIHTFHLPYYDNYVLKIPSILKSMKMIYEFEPDEVYISTPGPIGCLGLMISKLLSINSVGIYHTDFVSQVSRIDAGESSLVETLEMLDRWFYSWVDEIQVPTTEYFDILEKRGMDRTKMRIFQKGVDSHVFYPRPSGRSVMAREFGVEPGKTLLYVGRISKDKNMDFLMDVYRRLHARDESLNLVIVGNGPYLEQLRENMKLYRRVIFANRVRQDKLPELYSGADLFLFPSTTDTFGNVVVEAQACGCPALVSNIGGPQAIVQDGATGYVLPVSSPEAWAERINRVFEMMETNPAMHLHMREEARRHAHENYDWNVTLDRITSVEKAKGNGGIQREEEEMERIEAMHAHLA